MSVSNSVVDGDVTGYERPQWEIRLEIPLLGRI